MTPPAESSSTMRRVLEEVGAIVWEGDPQTYAFTYVSPAAERLLGYPAERWLEDPNFWVNHIHPEDRGWVLSYCQEQTHRLVDHEFDYRMVAANGRVVWLRDVVRIESKAGRPLRSVGVMVDVTSLKEAEARAELEATRCRSFEAQWRSLVDGVPDAITLLDEHGRVEFSNRPSAFPWTFMDIESAEAWRTAFTEVVTRDEPREIEVCVVSADQAPQWFMIRILPVQIAGRDASEVRRYLSIWTDLTERRHLEARLRQQQRLESIGTLASGVAHEINNPVQGILNYAELITEYRTDPEAVGEFAREIIQESGRVATIVRNLLAFARQGPDQGFEQGRAEALIESTLSLMHPALQKERITVELTVADGLPLIHWRVRQIQQVILNLVSNARDALDERHRHSDEVKCIAIRVGAEAREGAPWVRISIADRAGGIPEDLRPRIFDPFFTTKGRDQSAGLGLALSHAIATDHGGELSVDSEIGVGCTFHLDLPADARGRARARSP